MLEIIYGEAGTGKSSLLYKRISEAAEGGKKVFLFVLYVTVRFIKEKLLLL